MPSWRDVCAPIIHAVLHSGITDEKELRKALRDAYPFGQRKYHPYKIWCSEVAIQRKKKPPLGTFGPKKREMFHNPDQQDMFDA